MCDDLGSTSDGGAAEETARIPADCPLARAGSDASTATFALLPSADGQQQQWRHLQQQGQSQGAGSTAEEGEADCVSSSRTGAAPRGAVAAAAVPKLEDDGFDFSDAALEEANSTLAAGELPGGLRFTPVSARCGLRRLCQAFKIPPVCHALGASYMQRLFLRNPTMLLLAEQSGWFSNTNTAVGPAAAVAVLLDCSSNPALGAATTGGRTTDRVMHAVGGQQGLLCTYAACIYLAAKLADEVAYRRQLSTMLAALSGQRCTSEQAVELELMICDRLDWRLGPYACGSIDACD